MGADMMLCCVPACELTPERIVQIEQFVRGIPADDTDLQELMEQLGYDDGPAAKEGLLQAGLSSQDENREIVTLHIPDCPYLVRAAGGLSWGDPPSEGYTALEHIERCPLLWQLLEEFAREDALATQARSSKSRQD